MKSIIISALFVIVFGVGYTIKVFCIEPPANVYQLVGGKEVIYKAEPTLKTAENGIQVWVLASDNGRKIAMVVEPKGQFLKKANSEAELKAIAEFIIEKK